MNYYIQGDAANADKIKAAFERNGIDTSANSNYGISNLFYFSCNGEVAVTQNGSIINIIKTHHDYQELELPVEPKFKVGDRIIYGGKERTITFMDDHFYDFDGGCAGCRIELQDELLRPAPKSHYDVSNFKPFDKVLVRCSNDEEWMIEFYCKYDTLVHTSPHRDYPFMGIGDSYSQCIPFEGNEHLLGTTDMCDEQYINW